MSGFQQITVMGHLGDDPKRTTFNNGGSLTNLSVATSREWKDQNGEKQSRTQWHRIVVKGKAQDFVNEYFHKGDGILVVGEVWTRKYQDKNGNDAFTTEIIVSPFTGRISFTPGNKNQNKNNSGNSQSYQSVKSGDTSYKAQEGDPLPDDEVPF